jgi:hypothetical protein
MLDNLSAGHAEWMSFHRMRLPVGEIAVSSGMAD